MRLLILPICILLLSCSIFAQQGTLPGGLDVNKLMKMSPAEVAKYKDQMLKQASQQAKGLAKTYNMKLDESLLPDYTIKPPVKDLQRLSLIPSRPPTRQQLEAGIQQSKAALEAVAPKLVVDEVKQMTVTQNAAQLQSSSIALWLGDKPVEALLASMAALQKNSAEPVVWNNLAALFNMAGLEHKAIPVLQYLLQQMPTNSTVLNNMGQAYYGLGDISQASTYFIQCLTHDPLHPEANRSMGMICLFDNKVEDAVGYFEKELEVAYRKSTLAELARRGKKLNIYQIRKRQPNLPKKAYFSEIKLDKFIMPEFPFNLAATHQAKKKFADFGTSVGAEALYWLTAGQPTPAQLETEGKKHSGLYFYLVKELLKGLEEDFPAEYLYNFTDADFARMKEMLENYGKNLAAVKCPEAPLGAERIVVDAYLAQCCELKTAVTDAFLNEYNTFTRKRVMEALPRWKTYINEMINIVSLDPSLANKLMVYRTVGGYFSYLSFAAMQANMPNPPVACQFSFKPGEANAIIESARNVDLSCPSWLNLEYDVFIAKIKADCSQYALEFGKVLKGSYEHNFKSGTTTISAGAGIDAKFKGGLGEAGLKQMVFVSFDNNNTFSDFGLKGTAEVSIGDTPIEVVKGIGKVGGTIAGIEGGYTWSINSGVKTSVVGKGIFADFVKIDKPL